MIVINEKQFQKVADLLKHIPGGAVKAMVTSLNRAIRGAKGDAAKYVADRYNVTQGYVRSRLLKPRLANYRMLAVSIGVTSRSRNLTSFKMNLRDVPRGKGARTFKRNKLKVAVERAEKVKPLRRHFLIRAKRGGSLLVAIRREADQKSPYPIDIRHGPSISQMLGHKSVVEGIEIGAEERLAKDFDHEAKRIMKGYGK